MGAKSQLISSVDISFMTDSSIQVRLTHINTMIVTLQNLNGPGTGCPAVSTTLCVQQKDLQNGRTTTPAPSPLPWHPHPLPPAPQCRLTLSHCQFAVSTLPSIPALYAHLPCWHGQLHRINGIELPCQCQPLHTSFLTSFRVTISAQPGHQHVVPHRRCPPHFSAHMLRRAL